MNILILGSGGREHILAKTYSRSKKVKKIFVVPGNPLMVLKNSDVVIFPEIRMTDYEKILEVCKKQKIDLTKGLIDTLQKRISTLIKNGKLKGRKQSAEAKQNNRLKHLGIALKDRGHKQDCKSY